MRIESKRRDWEVRMRTKKPKVHRTRRTTRVKRNPPKGKVGDGSY